MYNDFQTELQTLINKYSKENESNTPDFILAQYLHNCLYAFDKAIQQRTEWYGGTTDEIRSRMLADPNYIPMKAVGGK